MKTQSLDRLSKGQTVLLGTCSWDIESDSFSRRREPGYRNADIWWQQINTDRQKLTPLNGAMLALVRGQDFEKITKQELKRILYSKEGIFNSNLKPGTTVAIRTAEGNFAKLRLIKYRDLNDL